MRFDVLSPSVLSTHPWWSLIGQLEPSRSDVHFQPDYAAVQEAPGLEIKLCVGRIDERFIIQPFAIRRSLVADEEVADLESPYGYGGPISFGCEPSEYDYFMRYVDEWARSLGVVSQRTVLHPFLVDHQKWLMRYSVPEPIKPVVYMYLGMDFRQCYAGNRIAGVKIAKKNGVRVEQVEPLTENVQTFCRLYRETMYRHSAAPRWFFSDSYFADHFAKIQNAWLFFAFVGEDVEVATIVLGSARRGIAHYHFSGTAGKHTRVGANDLMLDHIAEWSKRNGFARLHLGGGATAAANDSLLVYKASFSTFRAPVHVTTRILDEQRYLHLCSMRGIDVASTNFFPAYRAERA